MAAQDRQKQKILVTGATGFLGRHVVRLLLAGGYGVRALVREAARRETGLPREVEIADGDVLDVLSLEAALEGVAAVIHTAAVVSFWRKDADRMMQVNEDGTANVVNVCLEAGVRLLHVSSIAALGVAPAGELTDEHTEWQRGEGRSAYSISKYKAEQEVMRGIAEGLDACLVHPSVILGPAHNWEEGTGKLFTIVNRGLRFYNPGSNGFVGVEDVARALLLLLEARDLEPGSRFLLNAENLGFRELFGMMAAALGKPAPRWRLPKIPTMLVAALSEVWSGLSGKPPVVTRDSMRSGFLSRQFDGSKIEALGLQYTPISVVIAEAANAFRASRAPAASGH